MSSYRPDEMSPSDRADIASWTEREEVACDFCGCSHEDAPIHETDAGRYICEPCDYQRGALDDEDTPQ